MKRSSLSGKRTPFVASRNLRVQGLAGNIVEALDGCSGCGMGGVPRRTLRTRGIAGMGGGMGDGMMETLWGMMNPDVEYTPPSTTRRTKTTPSSGGEAPSSGTGGQSTVTQVQQVCFSVGCDPRGIDGEWGPNTSAAVRCYIQRMGRSNALAVLGAQWVQRAEADAQGGRVTPAPSRPSPVEPPSEPPPSGGGPQPGADINLASLFGGGGGAASPLGPLGDPMFLGMVGLGVLGAILVAGQLKKGKKEKGK